MTVISNPDLQTLRTAPLQDILDTAYAAIITQGGPSMSEDATSCRYRGPDNRKCAIGHFIPDSLYSTSMEGHDLRGSNVASVLQISYNLERKEFLLALQRAHDDAAGILYRNHTAWLNEFNNHISNLAERFNLTSPVKPAS